MTREDISAMAEQAAMQSETFVQHGFDDVFLERFAALVAAAERNKLAAWMRDYGFATGHGDTMEQLCDALGTEIVDSIEAEILAEKHRILRIVYEQLTPYGKTGECAWIGVKHNVGKK